MYRIPEIKTEKRLAAWRQLRLHLENSITPFEDVVEFFSQFPQVKIYTDPYDRSTWPTPWELIEENEYCPFNMILAICYTIQLCERFNNITPKIAIAIDNYTKTVYYLLFIDEIIYGLNGEEWIPKDRLDKSLNYIKIYTMPPLH